MDFLQWPDKDPDAIKDYAVDWAARLLTGEVIDTSTWDISPVSAGAPLTTGVESIVDSVTSVWLSGGVVGQTYTVTNHIVTDRGMEDDRTVTITIVQQ